MAELDRRKFLSRMMTGMGAMSLGSTALTNLLATPVPQTISPEEDAAKRVDYRGPNVIIIRFGGGVRRRETIDERHTYCPYLLRELTKRGTLFRDMEIASLPGVQTSHGQGTLNILTGKYDGYEDVNQKFLGERFEAKVPTLYEYLRKAYEIPEHQTLIVNGEDRIDEEFYTFSNHHLFGVDYRSNVLSLFRFKVHLLRRQIEAGEWSDEELKKKKKNLAEMETLDKRATDRGAQAAEIRQFWERWGEFYGDTGLVNPRGDRVLTELAIRAIRELRPRLMMVNYNDCDYIHWGHMSHYTRGIQIMDEGLQRIVEAVERDDEYRDNTIFAVVPDCGRDTNRFVSVPCQHHFGSRSSHEIFALLFGAGVPEGQVVDRRVDQISVTSTLGALMKCPTTWAEGRVLEEAIA